MLRIRLQRKGRKKRPIYHVVVADSRNARDGRIIEQVGRYDNVTEKKEVVLNEDRIFYWLDSGAQPSDTVRKILRQEGLLYKRHLMMWGKSEEEIEAALSEWRQYRESKESSEATRKEQYKAVLAAEEKEYKNQVEKKAAKAAVEMDAEKAEEEAPEAEASTEETTDEAATETAEAAGAVEEVVEEEDSAVAEEPTETAEKAEEETETAAETAGEETAEEAPSKEDETEEEDSAVAEEPTEAAAETEEAEAEEAKKEEPAAEATQTSVDMTAKEAVDHIRNTDLENLKGFITDDEERKTVLAAWESKQEG